MGPPPQNTSPTPPISDAKRIEKRLQKIQKFEALGTLVAGVAHEINNPVNLLMLNIPVLHGIWNDFKPVLKDYVQRQPGPITFGGLEADYLYRKLDMLFSDMNLAVNRIAGIVKNLKRFAQEPDHDAKTIISMNQAVHNALLLAQSTLQKAEITLEQDLAQDLPSIEASLPHIEQIVLNLVINAIEAISPEQGRITIATRFIETANEVQLTVSDTGPGIDPDIKDKIFDPFFTSRQSEGGTGLGLAITHNLVTHDHGSIRFRSQQGHGTTFYVTFPVHPFRPPKRILIVDDDRQVIKLLER